MEDNQVRRLFQDQPIDRSNLKKMQMNIMSFVMANPIDFREKINLQKRRQWGLAVTATFFIVGLLISALLWFFGDSMIGMIRQLVIEVAPYLPISWFTGLGQAIYEKIKLITALSSSFKLIWQNYSTMVMVLLGIWVIHRGISNRSRFTE